MNNAEKCLLELLEIQHKLEKLKEQNPSKFYELKEMLDNLVEMR